MTDIRKRERMEAAKGDREVLMTYQMPERQTWPDLSRQLQKIQIAVIPHLLLQQTARPERGTAPAATGRKSSNKSNRISSSQSIRIATSSRRKDHNKTSWQQELQDTVETGAAATATDGLQQLMDLQRQEYWQMQEK